MIIPHIRDAACGRTQQITQVSPELCLILNRHLWIPFGILKEQVFNILVYEILLMGERGHYTTGQITEDLRFPINRFPG